MVAFVTRDLSPTPPAPSLASPFPSLFLFHPSVPLSTKETETPVSLVESGTQARSGLCTDRDGGQERAVAAIFDALPPDFSAAVQVHKCVFGGKGRSGARKHTHPHPHAPPSPLALSPVLPCSLSVTSLLFRRVYCALMPPDRGEWTGRFQTVQPPPLSLFLSFYVSLYCALNAHNTMSILCAQCPQYSEYIVRSMLAT